MAYLCNIKKVRIGLYCFDLNVAAKSTLQTPRQLAVPFPLCTIILPFS